METQHHLPILEVFSKAILAAAIAAPTWVHGAEPLDIVCQAFRASSNGSQSGTGSGRYRHYEAVPGGDFQLKIDAAIHAVFKGQKYRVDLKFDRDMLGLDARRIIYDGVTIADVMFSRNIHPSGA